jgi:PAS domain S-box-containing protein
VSDNVERIIAPSDAALTPGPMPADHPGLDGLPDGILVLTRDVTVVYANPAAEQLLGYGRGELLGTSYEALVPPKMFHLHRQARAPFLEGPDDQRVSAVWSARPLGSRDGTRVPVSGSVAVAPTPNGRRITVVIRAASDVDAVMRSEEHLALSQSAARMGSWTHDYRTRRGHWSAQMYELLGVRPGTVEPGGAEIQRRVHPDDYDLIKQEREDALRDGGEVRTRFRLLRGPIADVAAPGSSAKPDDVITVQLITHVETDEQGRPLRTIGTLQDVTATEQLEAKLTRLHSQVRGAFDRAPIAMALITADADAEDDVENGGRILFANRAFLHAVGAAPDEVEGRRLQDLLTIVEPASQAGPPWSAAASTGEEMFGPVLGTLVSGSGAERWMSVSGSLVHATPMTPGYYIAHLVDVTEERRTREREREIAARDARIATILQSGLVPYVPSRVGPMSVASRYRAAGAGAQVGGDWSDVFTMPDGRVGIVVGDVAGHGIEAALTMTRLRSLIRMLASSGLHPAGVMRRLNDALNEGDLGNEVDMATVVHGQLDPVTGVLTHSSAGHLPLITVSPGRHAVPVPAVGGPPVGALVGHRYHQDVLAVEPGARLIGYTDGLIERRGLSLDQALLDLVNCVSAFDATVVADVSSLADAVLGATCAEGTIDDVVVLVVGFDPTITTRSEAVLPRGRVVTQGWGLRDRYSSEGA